MATDDVNRTNDAAAEGNAPVRPQVNGGEKLGEVVEGMVAVFDTQDESEAMVVKGLLESSGIDAVVNSIDAQQDILPGVGGVVVLVNADQVEDARQIITAGQATAEEDLTSGAA